MHTAGFQEHPPLPILVKSGELSLYKTCVPHLICCEHLHAKTSTIYANICIKIIVNMNQSSNECINSTENLYQLFSTNSHSHLLYPGSE